jgi:simple sugar transport system ATP-binding protein
MNSESSSFIPHPSSLFSLRGVTRRFGPVTALDGVDFDIRAGEIHALLGENGAGKSTLMNILFGALRPDAGTIESAEFPNLKLNSSRDAIAAGIGMVHQHFHLVETFTVRENVLLGDKEFSRWRREPFAERIGLYTRPSSAERLAARAEALNLSDKLDAKVESLPVGLRQRVEILKALYRDARVLLLDEPTSVLTPLEVDGFFELVRDLRDQGTGIVFITHKLGEAAELADRVTVMRRGKVVATFQKDEADPKRLAEAMVGRALAPPPARTTPPREKVLLSVANLSTVAANGRRLRDISFEIRVGEIFGVAGVDGNGQTELAEAVVGLIPATGEVKLDGQPLPAGRKRRMKLGVGYVPADRRAEGLALDLPLSENAILGFETRHRRRGFLNPRDLRDYVGGLIERFDIRAPGPDAPAGALSGGNQQKLLFARELAHEPKVLVAVNPTWGVDIGAVETIHRALLDLRDRGAAILLISNELEEIRALSDRFAVLHDGRLSAPLPPDAPAAEVGLLMAGAKKDEG